MMTMYWLLLEENKNPRKPLSIKQKTFDFGGGCSTSSFDVAPQLGCQRKKFLPSLTKLCLFTNKFNSIEIPVFSEMKTHVAQSCFYVYRFCIVTVMSDCCLIIAEYCLRGCIHIP